MSDERARFETRAGAEAFCRKRERAEVGASWLSWEGADGRWMAARTNLPRHDPSGTAVEAKPKPSPVDDPRTPQQRDAYWGGGG
jgi:hypothetical protein